MSLSQSLESMFDRRICKLVSIDTYNFYHSHEIIQSKLNFSTYQIDEVQNTVVDSKENGRAPSPILKKNDWGTYAKGVLYALQQEGMKLTQVVMGTQLSFHGIKGMISGSECLDSSGLSSSAAVGVTYLLALESANGLTVLPDVNIELDSYTSFKLRVSYLDELQEVGEVMTKKVDTTFRRLYEAYKAFSSKDDDNDSEDERTPNPIDLELDDIPQFGQITRHLYEEESNGNKNEVDKYLAEICEKNVEPFDILNWWKVNSSKYKVISQIGERCLSKSRFLRLHRIGIQDRWTVLDSFRSSLNPNTVEALICTQNWLKYGSPLDLKGALESFGDQSETAGYGRQERYHSLAPMYYLWCFDSLVANELFYEIGAKWKGEKENVVTYYILKILRLDICADTMVGNEMIRGISGGQKKRVTTDGKHITKI
ncbi:hypothetical protein Sjap_021260 [Stephania japonica]|uniref:HAT C-terminal dimerisation domain-containing protein n=1 Tax=Stephania japonica TaxID=461633 RepID=A0AAP0ES92_9MAGN